MIKIQYASDLHLEFTENGSFIKHHPLQVNGEVLVLAGDIGYIGDENYSKHPFWDWAADNYEKVIVIPGNHEFYKMYEIDNLYNGWSMVGKGEYVARHFWHNPNMIRRSFVSFGLF